MNRFEKKKTNLRFTFMYSRIHSLQAYMQKKICGGGGQQPPVGQGLLIYEVSRSHTRTHHSWLDSSG